MEYSSIYYPQLSLPLLSTAAGLSTSLLELILGTLEWSSLNGCWLEHFCSPYKVSLHHMLDQNFRSITPSRMFDFASLTSAQENWTSGQEIPAYNSNLPFLRVRPFLHNTPHIQYEVLCQIISVNPKKERVHLYSIWTCFSLSAMLSCKFIWKGCIIKCWIVPQRH